MDPSARATRVLVLGASGDLFGRYLAPALCQLVDAGHLAPDELTVVGVARDEWDDEAFRDHAAGKLDEHASELDGAARQAVLDSLRYRQGDATDAGLLRSAVEASEGPWVAYLALPPAVFSGAITAVVEADLPEGSRLVVEKPFGTDLESARALNRLIDEHLEERQVFRVDHFLGMQTVQNLLGLRFANRVLEPLWNASHLARVDIVWDETVALEGRAGYYDASGALRDMVQNHLLQLLALVAMERPESLDADGLQHAKAAALHAVDTPGEDLPARTRRARYTSGRVGDQAVPDYAEEAGVDPDRGTETFTEVELRVMGDRWRGEVPFVLRTGKALGRDRREIALTFRPVEALPFCDEACRPNRLTIAMDPDRIALDLELAAAGDPFRLEPATLDTDLAAPTLDAYGRLLLAAMDGDPVLSIRGDEAERSWEIVEPILSGWEAGEVPLETYRAGSDGP